MRIALVPAVSLLASCAVMQASAPVADVGAVEAYRSTGYASGREVSIRTQIVGAAENEIPWHVALTRVADRSLRPLVVFLPGLGEQPEAPNRWVDAWAGAGYAVLTVQPLAADADAWSSPDARSGDFQRVARERFSPERMPERIAQLATALRRVQARGAQGEAGLEALDWARVVLAGADLGAYAVQSLALAPDTGNFPVKPLAYIVISPHVVASAHAAPAPAGAAPVLMVSALDDVDDYGLVTDAAARHHVFDAFGSGRNLYLELQDASHRWLAGVAPAASAPGISGDSPRRGAGVPPEPGPRRSRSGSGAGTLREGVAPSGDEDEPTAEQKARSAAAIAQRRKELSQQLTHNAMSEVSFTAVSIAFLDAQLRARAQARTWLDGDAQRWLQDGARLKHG